MASKKNLTEQEIRTRYILPAIQKAGWQPYQIGEERAFTDGRIFVKGEKTTRGKPKRVDYILYYKPNIPVAIIEAKNNKKSLSSGIQQALDYGEILDVPVIFSSNGDGFYMHDKTLSNGKIERELSLDSFPTPNELWQIYKRYKKIETPKEEKIVTQDYFYDSQGRTPRYYQQIAINRTIEQNIIRNPLP